MRGWSLGVGVSASGVTAAVAVPGRTEAVEFGDARVLRVPATGVDGAVLREVAARAAWGREPGAPGWLVVAIPAEWGQEQAGGLRAAAAEVGLPEPVLMESSVATAWHLADRTRPGQVIAMVDAAADGADVTLLRRSGRGFVLVGRPGRVVAAGAGAGTATGRRVAAELAGLLAEAEASAADLAGVYVTGEASRDPAVTDAISQTLGVPVRPVPDPATAAARGAAECAMSQRETKARRAGLSLPLSLPVSPSRRAALGAGIAIAAVVVVAAGAIAVHSLSGTPAPKARQSPAASARSGQSPALSAGQADLYVIGAKMYEPALMTPIDSADNTAGRAINVGTSNEIVFSPRGEHAYLIGRPPGTSLAGGTLLTPFNSATDALGRAILVPGDENSIVFAPDGETAYILTTGSSSDTLDVTYLDTVTNTIGRSVKVPGDNDELAITPNGKTLYLTDPGGGTIHTPGWVIPIATGTGTVGRLIPAGDNPSLIAITPNGKTAYVLNTYSSSVTPITIATNTAGPPIQVCGPQDVVMDIAMAPDGGTVYVGCSGSTYIYSGDVTAISTATNAAEQTIPIDSDVVSISMAPDGGTVYVVGNGTSASSPGDVIGIDAATNTAELPITVGWNPGGLVFAPDGRTAYVVSSSAENEPSVSLVTPIDVAANTAGHPIPVNGDAGAIAART